MRAHVTFDAIHLNAGVVFYNHGLDGSVHVFVPEAGGSGRYEIFGAGDSIPESVTLRIPTECLASLAEEVRKMSLGVGQLDSIVLKALDREQERVDKLLDYATRS